MLPLISMVILRPILTEELVVISMNITAMITNMVMTITIIKSTQISLKSHMTEQQLSNTMLI
jgi:hypothetical protein